jgi:hypothetical protein
VQGNFGVLPGQRKNKIVEVFRIDRLAHRGLPWFKIHPVTTPFGLAKRIKIRFIYAGLSPSRSLGVLWRYE